MSAPTDSPSQELTSMRKRAERAEKQIALISRAAEMRQSDQPSQLAARLGAVRRLALPFSQPSTAPCAPVAVDPARAAAPPAGAGPSSPAAERRADHLLDEGRGYLADEEAS